jgi:hypothetical protein
MVATSWQPEHTRQGVVQHCSAVVLLPLWLLLKLKLHKGDGVCMHLPCISPAWQEVCGICSALRHQPLALHVRPFLQLR